MSDKTDPDSLLFHPDKIRSSLRSADGELTTTESFGQNIIRHDHSERTSWLEAKESNESLYGFVSAELTTKTTIQNTTWDIEIHTRAQTRNNLIGPKTGASFTRVKKTIDIENFLATLCTQVLDIAEFPEIEGSRQLDCGDIRVFIAPPIKSLLLNAATAQPDTPPKDTVADWIETVESLPELLSTHEPPQEYASILEAATVAMEAYGASSAEGYIPNELQKVEDTIRAKFGFSSAIGHSIPDTHPDYEDESLEDLKDQLETYRTRRDYEERAYHQLREILKNLRSRRKQDMADEHIPKPIRDQL